jgi:hypothetical protein
MRNGKMPTVTIEQAQRNFIKVCFLTYDLFVECCCPTAPTLLKSEHSSIQYEHFITFEPLGPYLHANALCQYCDYYLIFDDLSVCSS